MYFESTQDIDVYGDNGIAMATTLYAKNAILFLTLIIGYVSHNYNTYFLLQQRV